MDQDIPSGQQPDTTARRRPATCSVGGCGSRNKSNGLCSKHDQRLRKTGSIELSPKVSRRLPCAVPGCIESHPDCHFDGCGRPVRTRGLCNAHNQQHLAGDVPLRPLRNSRPRGSTGKSICTFEECERVDWKRGLCVGHYGQAARRVELTPLRRRRPGGVPSACLRDDRGRKWCFQCDKWRPTDDFYNSKREPDGLTGTCKACYKIKGRETVYRRHGLTREQYAELLESQGGVCAICDNPCRKGSLSVDHDHNCCPGTSSCGKCVRGLLCRSCNYAIGMLGDAPETVRRALDYLTATGSR